MFTHMKLLTLGNSLFHLANNLERQHFRKTLSLFDVSLSRANRSIMTCKRNSVGPELQPANALRLKTLEKTFNIPEISCGS